MRKDICYDDSLELKLDIYEAEIKDAPVYVYFYGGALERGRKEDSKELSEDLSDIGITVIVPDYHICPGQPYPDFIETAQKAVAFAADFAGKRPLFVGGHSSGAYVAMMLCFGGYLSDFNVKGYIFASGQTTTHAGILSARGENAKRTVVDDASPLYNAVNKYPPILLTIGERDSFPCRVEQNALLLAVLKDASKKADAELKILVGETHGSYLERQNGEKSLYCALVSDFVRKHV